MPHELKIEIYPNHFKKVIYKNDYIHSSSSSLSSPSSNTTPLIPIKDANLKKIKTSILKDNFFKFIKFIGTYEGLSKLEEIRIKEIEGEIIKTVKRIEQIKEEIASVMMQNLSLDQKDDLLKKILKEKKSLVIKRIKLLNERQKIADKRIEYRKKTEIAKRKASDPSSFIEELRKLKLEEEDEVFPSMRETPSYIEEMKKEIQKIRIESKIFKKSNNTNSAILKFRNKLIEAGEKETMKTLDEIRLEEIESEIQDLMEKLEKDKKTVDYLMNNQNFTIEEKKNLTEELRKEKKRVTKKRMELLHERQEIIDKKNESKEEKTSMEHTEIIKRKGGSTLEREREIVADLLDTRELKTLKKDLQLQEKMEDKMEEVLTNMQLKQLSIIPTPEMNMKELQQTVEKTERFIKKLKLKKKESKELKLEKGEQTFLYNFPIDVFKIILEYLRVTQREKNLNKLKENALFSSIKSLFITSKALRTKFLKAFYDFLVYHLEYYSNVYHFDIKRFKEFEGIKHMKDFEGKIIYENDMPFLPTGLESLIILRNRGYTTSLSKLENLKYLEYGTPTSMEIMNPKDLSLELSKKNMPPNLTELVLRANYKQRVSLGKLTGLKKLEIIGSNGVYIGSLPDSLTDLYIESAAEKVDLSYLHSLINLRFGDSFNQVLSYKKKSLLPSSLKSLSLGYSFGKPLTKLPESLIHLTINSNTFNHELDKLPKNLLTLDLNVTAHFDKTLDNIPKSLTSLNFKSYNWDKPIDLHEHMALKFIIIYSHDFDQPLDNLPPNLYSLYIISKKFNSSISQLPNNLEILEIGKEKEDFYDFNQPLLYVPHSLKTLKLIKCVRFNQSIDYLKNTNLKLLEIRSNDFDKSIDELPETLDTLVIMCPNFSKPIHYLPLTLKNFTLHSQIWNHSLDKIFIKHKELQVFVLDCVSFNQDLFLPLSLKTFFFFSQKFSKSWGIPESLTYLHLMGSTARAFQNYPVNGALKTLILGPEFKGSFRKIPENIQKLVLSKSYPYIDEIRKIAKDINLVFY